MKLSADCHRRVTGGAAPPSGPPPVPHRPAPGMAPGPAAARGGCRWRCLRPCRRGPCTTPALEESAGRVRGSGRGHRRAGRGHRHRARRRTDVRARAGLLAVVRHVHRGDALRGGLRLPGAAGLAARPPHGVHARAGRVRAGRRPVRGDRGGSHAAALGVAVPDAGHPQRLRGHRQVRGHPHQGGRGGAGRQRRRRAGVRAESRREKAVADCLASTTTLWLPLYGVGAAVLVGAGAWYCDRNRAGRRSRPGSSPQEPVDTASAEGRSGAGPARRYGTPPRPRSAYGVAVSRPGGPRCRRPGRPGRSRTSPRSRPRGAPPSWCGPRAAPTRRPRRRRRGSAGRPSAPW